MRSLPLALIALLAFTLPSSGEPPVPGKRMLNHPDLEKFASTSGNPSAVRALMQRAIRNGAKELVPRLNAAESIIIYSLLPERADQSRNVPADGHYFHGYKILGSKTVARHADLATWRKEFVEGLWAGPGTFCFEPRHAIRIHTRRTTTELVLCFHCGTMRAYGFASEQSGRGYFFDKQVEKALNTFLDAHKIKRDIPP